MYVHVHNYVTVVYLKCFVHSSVTCNVPSARITTFTWHLDTYMCVHVVVPIKMVVYNHSCLSVSTECSYLVTDYVDQLCHFLSHKCVATKTFLNQ